MNSEHSTDQQVNRFRNCFTNDALRRAQGVPSLSRDASHASAANPRLQLKLGVMHVRGEGVPQDYVRAYMWDSLAAAHSTGDAQKSRAENRDEIAGRMTPAQLAEAQRLSQQCQAQQFMGY